MRVSGLLTVLLLVVVGFLTGGCRQPLFTERDERSPFDRYDSVRNQRAPAYVMDEFGRRRPNLRERLLPRD